MNIALILASGIGSRVQSQTIPKQFVEIKEKPIFIHTVEKFVVNGNIDKIVLVCNKDWYESAKLMVNHYLKKDISKFHFVIGGQSRSESLQNGFLYIKEKIRPQENDVVLTHDSVRMFLSNRIIDENIKVANNYDCVVDTCVRAIDTLVKSYNGVEVSEIPNRSEFYYGQTPQTLKYGLLETIFSKEYDQKVFANCDLCKLANISNINIKMVEGDYFNFKITTDYDLLVARKMLDSNE